MVSIEKIKNLIEDKKLYPSVAPHLDEVPEDPEISSQVLWCAGVYDISLEENSSILTEMHEYYHSYEEAMEDAIQQAYKIAENLGR